MSRSRKYQADNRFARLWGEVSVWSQATFGTDDERGPIGPLDHLKKEIEECKAAILLKCPSDEIMLEFADLLILVCDAARRHKISQETLISYALSKMQINRNRIYHKPTDPNAVSEHVRDEFVTPPLPGME